MPTGAPGAEAAEEALGEAAEEALGETPEQDEAREEG